MADDLKQVFDPTIRPSACLGHSTIGAAQDAQPSVDTEIKDWILRVRSYATDMDDQLPPPLTAGSTARAKRPHIP